MVSELTNPLLQLQDMDTELRECALQIKKLQELPKTDTSLEQLRARYAALKDKQINLQKSLQADTASEEILRKKAASIQEAIYGGSVKNLKEAELLEEDRKNYLRKADILAESIINSMLEYESLPEQISRTEKELLLAERTAGQEAAKNEREIRHRIQKLKELKADRDKFLASLDTKLQYAYNNLYDKKRRPAVAEIKDKRCSGCSAQLPENKLKEVMKNKLMFCEMCGRILAVRRAKPKSQI